MARTAFEKFVSKCTFSEEGAATGHWYFSGKYFSVNSVVCIPRRAIWILLKGPVQAEEVIARDELLCQDINCIASHHSKKTTRSELISVCRENAPDPPARSGEKNSSAKLSDMEYLQLQEELNRGESTRKALAAKYGVSYQHCCRIANGKRSESKEERNRQTSSIRKNLKR